jgi:hypothetical protein
MTDQKLLRIYLNDHLAGSVAGLEIAKRSASSNEGSSFGGFLQGLTADIEQDKRALETIMDTLGVPQDALKQGAAWVAEKLGRLKLNGQVTGYSDLSRLVELEGLSIGVEGKASLWRSLKLLSASDERLDGAHLDELIGRAESQRDELETFRLKAAELALTKSS